MPAKPDDGETPDARTGGLGARARRLTAPALAVLIGLIGILVGIAAGTPESILDLLD